MMSKFESVYKRLETLMADKEKERIPVTVGAHEQMSESGSEEKVLSRHLT